MTLPLFYADPTDIDSRAGFMVLTGGESRHLALSLRAKPGDRISVADGQGSVYQVSLAQVEPEMVRGSIESRFRVEQDIPGIVLFQAVTRMTKMDEVVARAAEAGIAEVVAFMAPRSPAGSGAKALRRLSRWRKIAVEASKVSRRALPLQVSEHLKWPIEEGVMAGQEMNLVLWEDESSVGLRRVLPGRPPRSLGLVVGPEGGLESDEVSLMAERGAVPVSIGGLILRTETAGAYAAMIIRYNYDLLEPPEV